MDDAMVKAFEAGDMEAIAQQVKAEQERVHATKEYQDAKRYAVHLFNDFFHTTRGLHLAASRAPRMIHNSLVFRFIGELWESTFIIWDLLDVGAHNAARREMRYMLENAVKYVYVDTTIDGPLEDRIKFLHDKVPQSSVEMIDQVHVGFEEPLAQQFIADVKQLYSELCAYVHPSKAQIESLLNAELAGGRLRFDTPRELEQFARKLFRLYDIILVLIITALGYPLFKDIYEVFYDMKKWKFHKGRYMREYTVGLRYYWDNESNQRAHAK